MHDYKFAVKSIQKVEAPVGTSDKDWYRYVIGRDDKDVETNTSVIVGDRCGSKQQVTDYANELVESFNERNKGYGRSLWAPRQKKQ